MSSYSPSGRVPLVLFCLSCVEVKSLVDDRVRTGVCKLLSNLCCYELLSTSGFLRFDIIHMGLIITSCLHGAYPVEQTYLRGSDVTSSTTVCLWLKQCVIWFSLMRLKCACLFVYSSLSLYAVWVRKVLEIWLSSRITTDLMMMMSYI